MASYQQDAPSDDAAPARLGRYELLGRLAVGGMAEIHLARLAGEGGFEKTVVVKRLLPELVASQAYVAMFLDEGKLVARLDHPNVCEVHELGRDGGEYFLAMPFLDGVSVHELIARPREADRLAELRVAAGILVQAAAGLHHAHELRDADGAAAGLVHRDVSPSNLFVTAAGVVKVLDFGIAKVRGAQATEVGTIKGKTQYMAPEQLLGEPLDRRCDVFALGIVAFELATHQRLFKRASDYLAARAILEEPIPRADGVDPAIPAAIADVIAGALARDPAARPPDAAAFARALEAALAPHGGLASSAAIAAVVTATDELTAQRTRQARVLGEARREHADPALAARDAGADLAAGAANAPEATARARAPLAAAGRPVAGTDAAPTRAQRPHASGSAVRRGRWIAIVLALSAVVIGGGVALRAPRRSTATAPGSATATGSATDTATTSATGSETASAAGSATASATGSATASATGSATAPATGSATAPATGSATGSAAAPATGSAAGTATAGPRRGSLSIDSTPFATIYLDGKRLDVTPILGRAVPAGRHTLRAVLEDGRTRELAIDVPAGRTAKPIVLTW